MTTRLGLSLDLGLGQGLPCQPPSGLVSSVPRAGTSGSLSEERRRAKGAPGSSVPQDQMPVPAVQEVDSPAAVATSGQAAPSAPRAPEVGAAPKSADPSVGAVVVPGEATDAVVAPSPPNVSSVPTSTLATVVADSPAEPSTAPDVRMVGASPLAVVPDLPVPGPEEGGNTVAEVGDRKPATLIEGKPSASMAMELADVSTAKSLFIRRESSIWGSLWSQRAALAKANERLAQQSTELADFRLLCDDLKAEAAAAWAEAALARTEAQQRQQELGQAINERDQSRSQATEAVGRAEALEGQLAEVSARAEALTVDLAVAVESAQSAQVVASQERARAEAICRARDDS
eukprot:XP_008657403.1 uncharacterized protein LOC103636866 [Zea mays]